MGETVTVERDGYRGFLLVRDLTGHILRVEDSAQYVVNHIRKSDRKHNVTTSIRWINMGPGFVEPEPRRFYW